MFTYVLLFSVCLNTTQRRVDTEVEGDLDPYVIYGGDYTGLREKLVYAQKTITTYIEEEKVFRLL